MSVFERSSIAGAKQAFAAQRQAAMIARQFPDEEFYESLEFFIVPL